MTPHKSVGGRCDLCFDLYRRVGTLHPSLGALGCLGGANVVYEKKLWLRKGMNLLLSIINMIGL